MNSIRCIWLWGPTGCGKNRWIYDSFESIYPKNHNSWWDGYYGQEVVTLDNMMRGSKLIPAILRWVDNSRDDLLKAKRKPATRLFKWFFITSTRSLDDCLKGTKYHAKMKDTFEVFHYDDRDKIFK